MLLNVLILCFCFYLYLVCDFILSCCFQTVFLFYYALSAVYNIYMFGTQC